MRALKVAAAGMTAQQLRVETISITSRTGTPWLQRPAGGVFRLHYQQVSRGYHKRGDGTVLLTGVQLG